jgi:hypothetical protein
MERTAFDEMEELAFRNLTPLDKKRILIEELSENLSLDEVVSLMEKIRDISNTI